VLGVLEGTIPPSSASGGHDLMVGSTGCKLEWGEKVKIIYEVSGCAVI